MSPWRSAFLKTAARFNFVAARQSRRALGCGLNFGFAGPLMVETVFVCVCVGVHRDIGSSHLSPHADFDSRWVAMCLLPESDIGAPPVFTVGISQRNSSASSPSGRATHQVLWPSRLRPCCGGCAIAECPMLMPRMANSRKKTDCAVKLFFVYV